MIKNSDEVMTLKQVADYFKVSEITVHRLTQRGVLPGVKIGRQWRYFRKSIELIVCNSPTFHQRTQNFEDAVSKSAREKINRKQRSTY